MNFPDFTQLACATCIAQEGQPTTLATNAAVYVMFGALGLIMLGIAGVFVGFARRARRVAAEPPAPL